MPRTLPPYRPGLGGNPVGAAVGVQGFVSATNFLRTNVGVIMPGNVNGFFVSVAVHVLSVPAGTTYLSVSQSTSADGWILDYAAGTTLVLANEAGVTMGSPVSLIAAGDVGKILLFVGVYDQAAGRVRLYRVGVQVGAGTVIVGYTPVPVGGRAAMGASINGNVAVTWARIVGVLYGTGSPQPADILAHYNACKAANTMESMGGVGVTNINRWQAKDNIPNAAAWPDDLNGMVLNRTGTLSSVVFTPQWE